MDITRDQQLALDDVLVAPANQLKIGKSNLRLSSDLNSKEATFQVVYDVLKLTPFYKAFQITADWIDKGMTQCSLYGAIFPNDLINEAIKDSESYKEYYAIALGAEPPKTKASVMKKQTGSDKTKTPPTTKGKRLKTLAKAAKPTKKKQPAKTSKSKGLTVLSKVALTEAKQIELATKRSLIQTHSSHASGSGTDEGTGDIPGVPDEDDDEASMSDDDDDDADNQDDDDNDDDDQNDNNTDNKNDDFVHPKFSTHDEEDNDEEGSDLTGEELDEEATNEEDEANELYTDVNVNLEGRDTEMTDAPRTIIQTNQVIKDTHSTLLVDVSVTTIAELPLLSAIILPPPPIPLITHLQQTLVPTPATVPSSSLQDLNNFSSLFGIVDVYLANKMHEAIKTATSHVVATNLSELELKKILINKMKSNKSIHRSDEQKNLYKALVDAYESDKLVLDTYGDTISFKRCQDDEDKYKEPSAGSNQGSKRRRAGKEP
ncbi:hypothetical protein Tco_0199578 [Tanacetum coccineum]